MNLIASPTVNIFSASLSEISDPNSSSKAITKSTVSKLSAPKSSIKLASSVTLSAVGAVIYNSTNSDKLVVVLDFGGTKTSTIGDFTIQFPAAGASTAIIRIA